MRFFLLIQYFVLELDICTNTFLYNYVITLFYCFKLCLFFPLFFIFNHFNLQGHLQRFTLICIFFRSHRDVSGSHNIPAPTGYSVRPTDRNRFEFRIRKVDNLLICRSIFHTYPQSIHYTLEQCCLPHPLVNCCHQHFLNV